MTKLGEEAENPMSGTPTPTGGRSKRRGLALPPRGQALSRLQDLEAETDTPVPEAIDAVNTARSNAVNEEGSTSVLPDAMATAGINVVEATSTPAVPVSAALAPVALAPVAPAPVFRPADAPTYRPVVRAAREPTTRITVDMPDSLHRQISMLSAETRRSIKELVIEALETTYFGKQENGR